MATDLFFLESDRHRVVLLAKLLVKLGVDANPTSKPADLRSDTVLVICTSAALRERWLTDIFGNDASVVALLLDAERLPRRCTRAAPRT